jgi:hypothetical protein
MIHKLEHRTGWLVDGDHDGGTTQSHFLQDLESLNGTVAAQARSRLIGQKEFRSHHQLSAQANAALFSSR